MAYQGLRLDDAQLYSVLKRLSAAQGALPIIHCENGLVCDELRKEALSLGHYSPVYHGLTRPALQEAEAVGRAMDIAGLADSPLYIVHVSCAEAMERISAAQRRGQRVFAETCPQYLALTAQVLEQPGGERFVCAPPPRGPEDHSALWRALSSGDIQVLATDHCPFTLSEKAAGSDFTEVPGGLPGVEARLALIFTLGVVTGRLSLSQWVDRCCSGPARMHGLRTKGQIAPGFDADLVIFDPNRDVVLTADTLHERVDWTPYEGLRLQGWPKTTICCGRVVVQDGMFVAEPGRGRFVARQLSQ
jgi:dihydropyrimidinase